MIHSPLISLLPQMLPKKQKADSWKQGMMDRFEAIANNQLRENLYLLENYEMVKGRFFFKHYLDKDQYQDMVSQLSDEFDLPHNLRHYDIISPMMNVLSGEFQKRPDTFKVNATDEISTNEYTRTKTDLLMNYIRSQVDQEVTNKLLEQGLDPEREDFETPEEMQQYQQMIEQQRQAMTPPEIEKYMSTTFMTAAEMWGEHQIKADRERFNLTKMEMEEFEDTLIADRCFRHFYLKGDNYEIESWNPVHVFHHQSPEIDEAEKGDYIGRRLYLTAAAVIDRWGHEMKRKQIKKLEKSSRDWKDKTKADSWGIPYGSVVPWEDYPTHKIITDAFGGQNPIMPDQHFTEATFNAMFSTAGVSANIRGLCQITEAYWKSQKKLGLVTYLDPETANLESKLVDEDFIVPPDFKEIDGTLYISQDLDLTNTVIWTWVNEVWRGVKIIPPIDEENDLSDPEDHAIYLNIRPLEFQFKSPQNPFGALLPVCGSIFNNRNGQSMSFVDRAKSHQIGYNLAINQLVQIAERETGRFLIFDVTMMPLMKDWAGEKGWVKFMTAAKALGFAPADSSPENMEGSSSYAKFPTQIDLDESARMLNRMNIAAFFKQQALEQVGLNPQRMGNVTSSETATGVNQALSQSFASTETYYTKYNNFKRRCLQMNLDIAQYCQSQKESVIVSYIKSDMSKAFIKIFGKDLLLRDLGVYVSNSQELTRQLETLRQLAIENNTSGATMDDLATVITSNSVKEIRAQLKASAERLMQQQNQASQDNQAAMQQQQEMFAAEKQFEAEQNQLDRENKVEIAYINSFSRQDDNLVDADTSGTPDLLEYTKLSQAADKLESEKSVKERQLQIKRDEMAQKERMQDKDLIQKQNELKVRERLEQTKLKIAKENKNKNDVKK